jgi:hypothetical protein
MCLSRGVRASSDCPAAARKSGRTARCRWSALTRHTDQGQVMALKFGLQGVLKAWGATAASRDQTKTATRTTLGFPGGGEVCRDADAIDPQRGRAGVNAPLAQVQDLGRHIKTLRQGGRHRALFPSQGGSANLSREPGQSSNQGHSITPDVRKRAGPFPGPRHATSLLALILGAPLRWLKASLCRLCHGFSLK